MALVLNSSSISGLAAVGGLSSPQTGSVLQVVNGTYGTEVYSSSSTFADTGLTATITPTSATSKILVLVDQVGVQKNTNNVSIQIKLFRNGTEIAKLANESAQTNSTGVIDIGSVSGCVLDLPATTSAIVYKTQFATNGNAAQTRCQGGNSLSTITLMEIAA